MDRQWLVGTGGTEHMRVVGEEGLRKWLAQRAEDEAADNVKQSRNGTVLMLNACYGIAPGRAFVFMTNLEWRDGCPASRPPP